ncbi:hypothetical protein FRB91_004829 [Serendipita sp. 411]|nr:hypothetical protein FRB91_004829 [Serendipita sp. 411]
MSLGTSASHSPVLLPSLMNHFHDSSFTRGATTHKAANSHQIWRGSSNAPEVASSDQSLSKHTGTAALGPYAQQMWQGSRSDSSWQPLGFGVQEQDEVNTYRKDVGVGAMSNYSGYYPPDRVPTLPSPRRQLEEQSTSIHKWNDSHTSMNHSSGLTITPAIIPNPVNMNPLAGRAGTRQLPSDWLIPGGISKGGDIHPSQTNQMVGPSSLIVGSNLNVMTRFDRVQRVHEGPVKRENDHPLSTLFDLSPIATGEPTLCAEEALAPTSVVKNGSRYICSICTKDHARPSRAIACENGHLGYLPFTCDGTCGNLVCVRQQGAPPNSQTALLEDPYCVPNLW